MLHTVFFCARHEVRKKNIILYSLQKTEWGKSWGPSNSLCKNCTSSIFTVSEMTVSYIRAVCDCFELGRVINIWSFLPPSASRKVMSAFVLSRLDYYNDLLVKLPDRLQDKLQRVQNNAKSRPCYTFPPLTSVAANSSSNWLQLPLTNTVCHHDIPYWGTDSFPPVSAPHQTGEIRQTLVLSPHC